MAAAPGKTIFEFGAFGGKVGDKFFLRKLDFPEGEGFRELESKQQTRRRTCSRLSEYVKTLKDERIFASPGAVFRFGFRWFPGPPFEQKCHKIHEKNPKKI